MRNRSLQTWGLVFANVALGLIMILAKALGFIKWSWAIVLTPVWVWPIAFAMTALVVISTLGVIEFIMAWRDRRGHIRERLFPPAEEPMPFVTSGIAGEDIGAGEIVYFDKQSELFKVAR